MTNKINKYEVQLRESQILKNMHLPTGKKGDSDDMRNTLYSVHQRGKQKTLWYLSSWDSMDAHNVPTNVELVTYKSKTYPYHGLHRSLLTTVTPEINVKDGYKIRFCDDLFISMVKEFKLLLNDTELQYGNDKFLLFDLKTRDTWHKMSKELGNKQNLTKWSDNIQSETLSLYIPWCYSKGKSDYFPLNFCGKNDSLEHVIEFDLKISNLLLMQDSEGNEIEFDSDKIEVSGNLDSIPIPEMEGLYTMLTSKECEYNNCLQDEVNGEKEYYTESIYYIEDENEIKLGKKVQIKIDSKKNQPVTEIIWGAINMTKTKQNKSLVFTSEGRNPIKLSKLESSIGLILDNKSSYKTELGYNLFNKKNNNIKGLNYWQNSVLENEDDKKFVPGVNFSTGNITVTLREEKGDENFLVFGILKYTNRFIFKNFPKNQEERLNSGCTIRSNDDI